MKILFTAILIILVASGCSSNEEKKTQQTAQEQTATPKVTQKKDTAKDDAIVLTDTSGNKIEVKKISDGFVFEGYEGKVVLLEFFATWCPPCRAEVPHLNNLQKKYAKDMKIISVVLEEQKPNEEIIKFMNKYGVEYTIANSPDNFKLAKMVGGVDSIPFMLIYDRKGHYSQHYTGAVIQEMIEADIEKVL